MTRAPLDRAAHVARWVVLASFVGAGAGLLSAAFIEALDWTARTRGGSGWLIWLLPVAGLVVGSAYHYAGRGLERGSNLIIEQIHAHSRWIPVRMSVLIFVCSVISHLCGASVGREGAALQLAAGVTDPVSRRLGLDQRDRAVMLVAAIAGGFGSVVGVPVAGAVFALEVQRTGRVDHGAIVPAFTASIVGTAVVRMVGVSRAEFAPFPVFDWSPGITWRIAALGLACGLVAACYVSLTKFVRDTLARAVRWMPARPMIGGGLLLAIVLLGDWRDYQGLSLHLAAQAFDGSVAGQWPVKILLTSLSIGAGFVGGEVIPLFVTGALLGASTGHVLGGDPALFAMVGAVTMVSAALNTPVAGVFLGIELFGGPGVVLLAVACVTGYVSTGQTGIYSSQPVAAHKSGRRD